MYLEYEKRYLRLLENGKFMFDSSKKEIDPASLSVYEVFSYKKFIEILREERKTSTEKIYFCFLVGNDFVVFKKELKFETEPLALYHLENDEVKNRIARILSINDTGRGVMIIGNVTNHYNFLVHPDIFELLLCDAYLRGNGEEPFTTFKKKSKNGKIRDITAPHKEVKRLLRRINVFLQKVYDNRNADFQVAYKKGKSIKDNASVHIDNQYVFAVDLKDFFPSCKRPLVEKYIKFLFAGAYNEDTVRSEFLDVVLINDSLFIGSPISGTLANVIISKPVAFLKNLTSKHDMGFSVYADDMTFSSEKFITKDFIIDMFNLAFREYHLSQYFNLNEKKLKGFSGSRRKITGLIINDSNKISIPRKYYRDLRVKLHKLSLGDKSINIDRLRGKIAFPSSVDDSMKIYNLLKKFESTVKKYNLCSEETMKKLKERGETNV